MSSWTAGSHPRDAARLERFVSVRDVLGDSLPPGWYYFTAVLELPGRTLAFPTGSAFLSRDTLPPLFAPDSLRFRWGARLLPREEFGNWLLVEAVAANPSIRRVELFTGECPFIVELRPAGEPAAGVVWRSHFARDCTDIGIGYSFAPGQTDTLGAWMPVVGILGDSLPEGRYAIEVALLFQDTIPLGTTTVVLRRGWNPRGQG